MSNRTRVIFEAGIENVKDEDRGRVLYQAWSDRRKKTWHIISEKSAKSTRTHSTQHTCHLDIISAGERNGHAEAVLRLAIDVETNNDDDPLDKAIRVLDMPGATIKHGRAPRKTDVFGDRSEIESLRSKKIIGLLPKGWLESNRRITDVSTYLGSYGGGGIGLLGMQINGGSWLVLPLKHSESWITLTHETMNPSADRRSLTVIVDQRIMGVHPDQFDQFYPWAHNYAGHDRHNDLPNWSNIRPRITRFEADADGFTLEAGEGHDIWRFEMSPCLPRPIHAGSKEPRLLREGEDVEASFVLTHDCYIDV